MGDPSETVINEQGINKMTTEQTSSKDIKRESDRTTNAGGENEMLDWRNDSNENRHRKKKRHRHRGRGNSETAPESGIDNGGARSGHDGDNETGDNSSGEQENIVVSSSIRKKRSKASSRHHKHSSKDHVSAGDDSGLSLGNSLNESTVVGDLSCVDPKDAESKLKPNPTESQNDDRANNGAITHEENNNYAIGKDDYGDKKNQAGATHPKSDHPPDTDAVPSSTAKKEDRIIHGIVSSSVEQKDMNESIKTGRMHRRLERQKTQYRLEKEMLKKRLNDTKSKFQDEITKYEQDLSDHRQKYLEELSSLKLQEQYESLSVRIDDLGQLEDELDKRFKDCMEQQADIEEMERFINMREELCKSKVKDMTKLDDELDAWQDELDIKRRQLETADTSRRSAGTSINKSYSKPTTDEEDYILKKNLLKCKADLGRSEEENATLHKQLDALKKQFEAAQNQAQNHEKKIKQLEGQLVIALSQLGSQKNNHLNQNSLPPINGHRPSIASSSAESRIDEIKREMRSRRNLGNDQLSINQEAALRRKLSGKDSGVLTRSTPSNRASTRTLMHSTKEQTLREETNASSDASGSIGRLQSGEQYQDLASSAFSDVTRPASPKTEKSSVCALM